MKYKNKLILIFLILNFFACYGKNHTEENLSLKKIRLEEKIKEQTGKDLKKLGIKNLLFYNNGKCGGINEQFWFKENGEVLVNPYPSSGYKKGKFYWKIENNELYINPKNYRFNVNKFIKMSVKAIKATAYSGLDDLKKIKYALYIEDIEAQDIKLLAIIREKNN